MAIRQTKTNTLGQTELIGKQAYKKDIVSDSDKNLPKKLEKNKGFLVSTFIEMKKVQWPSIKYTANWSVVIVIFTTFFALSIGFIDHIFDSGLKYVQCTANITTAVSSDRDENNNRFKDCNTDLVKNISFRS